MLISCSPDLMDLIKAYEKAYNNHDLEGLMSLYTEEVRFEVIGSFVKYGKEEVRKLTEYDFAVNVHMDISDIRIDWDTVIFRLTESNDWFRLAGVDELVYEPNKVVFKDGLIKEIKSEITKDSAIALGKAWNDLMGWATKEKTKELSDLMPEGEFIYNKNTAKKWLELLKEWSKKVNFRS